MAKKFLQRDWHKYSKLGKGRKKKQRWRRPKGRDNKMRLQERGYSKVVSVGYKKPEKNRGKIEGKEVIIIKTVNQLEKIGENQIASIGRVGQKRKIEIAKAAKQKNMKIINLNISKFLKQVEKEKAKKDKEKKAEAEKKAKEKKKHDKKQEPKTEDEKEADEKAKEKPKQEKVEDDKPKQEETASK